jgi:hypothetical protein
VDRKTVSNDEASMTEVERAEQSCRGSCSRFVMDKVEFWDALFEIFVAVMATDSETTSHQPREQHAHLTFFIDTNINEEQRLRH